MPIAITSTVAFAPEDSPVVSVIVLAWQLETPLLECLRSLTRSVGAPAFEVIVVLNGATRPVREAVEKKVTGATLVDLHENIGFGGGCNAGVALARAPYVLFINDDATVEVSALRELHAVLENNAAVGAAAAVLLHADGTVQEAGSRVLSSAATIQLGSGLSLAEATDTKLLCERAIDYGSAAGLMVRSELLHSLGGFDPRYEPAYFEDVDLCFRLRAAGYEVHLIPRAHLIHHGGGSTRNNLRFRDFASDHAGIAFIERWADVLEKAPSADAPLTDLCPISKDIDRAIVDRPQDVSASNIALSISRNYAQWLNKKLDEEGAKNETHLTEIIALRERLHESDAQRDDALVRAESAERDRESFGTRLHELSERLQDLENRGPIGIVRWKAGVILRNRNKGGKGS